MAEHTELYQRAFYYDIIFDRDVSRDLDFLNAVYARYHDGAPGSVLELGCGPGYHVRAFARRGLRAVGLDLQPEMVAFAADKAAAEGAIVQWIAGDMRAFTLDAPVDLAITMFESIDALLTNDDLVRHLRCVAANLTPGGLYVIDAFNLGEFSYQNYGQYRYAGERDGIAVEYLWAITRPECDMITGICKTEVEMRVNDHGTITTVRDRAAERILFPQDLILLAALSGVFEVVAWYGDFDVDVPLRPAPESPRMIAVLRKT